MYGNVVVRRRIVLAALAMAGLGFASLPARAQGDPIKVGELNSYNRFAAFAVPYRNGMQLAQEEINAKGGVMGGRKLEIIFRDDGSAPGDAVRVAEELLTRENVAFLAGTFLSNVGLAVADFANQKKTLFIATEPLTDAITMGQGNRYTFRVRPSTYMQTKMLVEAVKAKGVKKWAIVAPNYEYGQSAAANFKKLIKAATPDAEIVGEQFPALGKIDAGATVQALEAAKPEGIFNVTFAGDLINFVRQGNTRGLFEGREVVSVLTGEPEYLDPLGAEAPKGWIVTGYPHAEIKTPEHTAFYEAYKAKFNDYPRLGSVVGFDTMNSIAAALAKAGTTDNEKLIEAMRGLQFQSAFGQVSYRAIDHQSTLGAYVGRLDVKDGKGVMVGWGYRDGAKYLPSDDEVKKLRPAST
jgi:branched-chain amino acid transport system substrate-binding protein